MTVSQTGPVPQTKFWPPPTAGWLAEKLDKGSSHPSPPQDNSSKDSQPLSYLALTSLIKMQTCCHDCQHSFAEFEDPEWANLPCYCGAEEYCGDCVGDRGNCPVCNIAVCGANGCHAVCDTCHETTCQACVTTHNGATICHSCRFNQDAAYAPLVAAIHSTTTYTDPWVAAFAALVVWVTGQIVPPPPAEPAQA